MNLHGEVGELAKYINAMLKKLQNSEMFSTRPSERTPQGSVPFSERIGTPENVSRQVTAYIERILANHDMMATYVGQLEASAREEGANQNQIRELGRLVSEDRTALMEVISGLSSWDLTGEKIKKILSMVEEIEKRVLQRLAAFDIPQGTESREEMIHE